MPVRTSAVSAALRPANDTPSLIRSRPATPFARPVRRIDASGARSRWRKSGTRSIPTARCTGSPRHTGGCAAGSLPMDQRSPRRKRTASFSGLLVSIHRFHPSQFRWRSAAKSTSCSGAWSITTGSPSSSRWKASALSIGRRPLRSDWSFAVDWSPRRASRHWPSRRGRRSGFAFAKCFLTAKRSAPNGDRSARSRCPSWRLF